MSSARSNTRTWVTCLRASKVIFDVNAEIKEVKVSADVKDGERDPAEQANGRQCQYAHEHDLGVGSDGRGRQCNGKREEQ